MKYSVVSKTFGFDIQDVNKTKDHLETYQAFKSVF